MERRQLHYLLAIARAGSFSRAATDLHMTQPPLSAAIASLETNLGTRLLDRTSRGVTLTAEGSEVIKFAERIETQEAELRRRLAALQEGRIGTLEVGSNPILTGTIIPRLLRTLSDEKHNLDISLHEAHPLEIIEAVQEGRVDVGVVATSSSEDLRMLYKDTLRVDRLALQEMIAVLPPACADLPDPLSLADIADLEFATPKYSMRHGIRFGLFDAFENAGLPHPRVREVPSMQESIPLITAGLAVGIMPESIRDLVHPDRVAIHRIADGPDPFEISVISRTDRAHLPAVTWFRETAIDQIRDS